MIVTTSEPSLTQLALTLATRPLGVAETSGPRLTAQTPTPAAAAVLPDDVVALLQVTEDVPDPRLPSSDLARRYAESGTLTPRPDQTAAAAGSRLTASDDQLLESLGRTLRASAAANSTPPPAATAQQPVMTLLVDGRAVPLNAAQLAAVRAAVGPSLRRLGPGSGTSDSEDPTTPLAGIRADERPVQAIEDLAPSTGADTATARGQPFLRGDGDQRSAIDDTADVAPSGAARQAGQPVPYEPMAITAAPPNTEQLGPGPEALAPSARATAVVSGLALAFAPGVSAQDVTARASHDHVSISASGRTVLALAVTTPLVAQLVFADGTTSLLHLND